MAFKLTYRDGQEDDYDDSTKWAVESGVLKMGRESGNWTVLVSPSHWATIEISDDQDRDENKDRDKAKDRDEDKDREKAKDDDSDDDEKDEGNS